MDLLIEKPHRNSPNILFTHAERKKPEKPRDKINIPQVDVKVFNAPVDEIVDTAKGDDKQIVEIEMLPELHPPDKSPKKSKKNRRHRDLTPVKEKGDALEESIYQLSQEKRDKGKRLKGQSENGDMLFGNGNSQDIKQSLK